MLAILAALGISLGLLLGLKARAYTDAMFFGADPFHITDAYRAQFTCSLRLVGAALASLCGAVLVGLIIQAVGPN